MNTKFYREPSLIHGFSSVKNVFKDAVENSDYPFYGAIRQQLGSASLSNLAQHLDAVRKNPCNIETTVNR